MKRINYWLCTLGVLTVLCGCGAQSAERPGATADPFSAGKIQETIQQAASTDGTGSAGGNQADFEEFEDVSGGTGLNRNPQASESTEQEESETAPTDTTPLPDETTTQETTEQQGPTEPEVTKPVLEEDGYYNEIVRP